MDFNTKDSPFHDLENKEFSLTIWLREWYPKICSYLNIDPNEDVKAINKVAEKYTSTSTMEDLHQILSEKNIFSIAPGINLEKEFLVIQQELSNEKTSIISIDGSTSFLISQGIVPDIIVSDLDGRIEDQLLAQEQGAILLLHVHGDNYQVILQHMPDISKNKFILTTQTHPFLSSFNFLGFTDGDRAICLVKILGYSKITVLGYDFEEKIGSYSKTHPLTKEQLLRKYRKFTVAKSIINWCKNNGMNIQQVDIV